jgi:phosphoglycerate kinase
MKTIQDIKIYKNKVFLVRADFNVPIKDNKIYDTFRIDQTFKTIDFLVKKGGIVNIVAHIGDDEKGSLFLIFSYLKKKYKKDISFFSGLINESTVSIINNERKTKIVLIENLRKNKGEKENIKSFSKTLSKLGDFYINDAFSVSHRKHASILGVTKYIPSFAGFQLQEEVKQLSKVFKPEHPFLFILGGNKFSTKLPLIKRYYDISDSIFLGGAF